MKLRNKKTGEIITGYVRVGIQNNEKFPNPIEYLTYNSATKFNEEWEDYKPKEPLIKDEKIRKIIRAWADENDSTILDYYSSENELVDRYLNIIGFNRTFNELFDKSYTIDELCGKEEE